MSVPLESLPQVVQIACVQLRKGLLEILGDDLVALWVYGAVTFEDRPRRLGDVDTHAVLRHPLNQNTTQAIDALHTYTAREAEIEWDSWYILEQDMASPTPPPHAFREDMVDYAWALHRAHWLAEQYVLLHGCVPAALIQPPTWAELKEGLRSELSYIEQIKPVPPYAAPSAAFVVLNGCRIIYSLRTQNVVVSKRAAGNWALTHLPAAWHQAIRAAERAYDDCLESGDAAILQAVVDSIVTAVRDEFA
jgi:hypothetical protein